MADQTQARSLRAVKPGDAPPPPETRQSVSEAARSGDRRALLVSIRDRVAEAVADPDCPKRDLASLTKRLTDVAREIELIDAHQASESPARDGGEVDTSFDASAI